MDRRLFLKRFSLAAVGTIVLTSLVLPSIKRQLDEDTACFNRMHGPFPDRQINALDDFIKAEKENGNWAAMDEFYLFGLSDKNIKA